jgi:hypothetical protein
MEKMEENNRERSSDVLLLRQKENLGRCLTGSLAPRQYPRTRSVATSSGGSGPKGLVGYAQSCRSIPKQGLAHGSVSLKPTSVALASRRISHMSRNECRLSARKCNAAYVAIAYQQHQECTHSQMSRIIARSESLTWFDT